MRRYKIPDALAHWLGHLLPKKDPSLARMDDHDYITILSWLEDWEPKQVYETAYKESHIPYAQTWEEWSEDMKPFPVAVKAELQRAMKIHIESGNCHALRAYAWFYEIMEKTIKYGFWSFCATVLLLWILK